MRNDSECDALSIKFSKREINGGMAGYKEIGRSGSFFVALVFSHDLISFLLFLLFPFIPISLPFSFLCSTGQDYQALQFPFSSFYISILWTEPRASHLLDKCYAL